MAEPRRRRGGKAAAAAAAAAATPGARVVVRAEATPWLYRPLALSGLALAFSALAWLAFSPPPSGTDDDAKVRRGLLGASIAFLTFCGLQLRVTSYRRPHPVIWRVLKGCEILYLLGVTYLLMQTPHDARMALRVFDAELGVLPEENFRTYAADCRLYAPELEDPWANVRDSADVFVLAHIFGWVVKAFIVRDWALLWVWSLTWELVEVSLQHVLPNFKECWWDHWVLDVTTCNLIGAAIGMALCKHFEGRRYDWMGLSSTPLPRGKLMRVIAHVTPFQWMSHRWAVLSSWRRMLYVITPIVVGNVMELLLFLLKFNLWLTPSHPVVVVRMAVVANYQMLAMREWYDYMVGNEEAALGRRDRDTVRIGSDTLLSFAATGVEALMMLKFWVLDPDQYGAVARYNPAAAARPHVPAPRTVARCWAVSLVAFVAWAFAYFGSGGQAPKPPRSRLARAAVNALLAASAAPLLLLYALDFADTFAL